MTMRESERESDKGRYIYMESLTGSAYQKDHKDKTHTDSGSYIKSTCW